MALITAQNVQKYFGSDHVLVDASLQLNEGERLCLVGPNGAGKTTLLRCIMGEEPTDAGSIAVLPTVCLGILEQHASFTDLPTVWEAALTARPELLACRAEARALEDAWTANDHPTDDDLNRYTEVHERLRHLGDEAYESDVKAALAGLGLAEATWEQTPVTLSGGQRTRLAIAHLLLAGTDVLCLDEPTNHLDVAAIEWLEEFLTRYPGAVLVISHDRYFMDQVGTKVTELYEGRTKSYPGNYSQFVRLKEVEAERQLKVFTQQQEEIQKLQIYIERYRAGNRATMSKSRQKALARIERVERPREAGGPQIQFRADVRSGDEVLQVRGVSKAFDGREVLREVSFEVRRGERVGIIGANGTGKTTLLKIVADEIDADAGAIRWGMNTEPGYFAQEMDMPLDGDTVIDALMDAAPLTIAEARDMLAQFGFRGDDAFRALPVLSGGERNRLQLAVLMARGANVVLLDEPTNHLDLASRDALQSALKKFAGTLLFVTHDRYLLHGIATRLLIVDNGGVTDFDGTYEEYRHRLERTKAAKPSKAPTRRGKAPKPPKPEVIEAGIQATEKRIAALTKILANPATYADPEAAPKASAEYDELTTRLPEMYAAWEAASEASAAG
jgi:ATP-binding cassette subfamily F protein 3